MTLDRRDLLTGVAAKAAARLSALAAGAKPAPRQATEFCMLRGSPVVFSDGTFDLGKFSGMVGVRGLAPWFMALDAATGGVEMLYQRPSGLFLSRAPSHANGGA